MSDDIQTLRRQLRQLRELHEGGALGAVQYEESRVAIERRLVDLVMVDAAAAEAAAPAAAAAATPAPAAVTSSAAPVTARASGKLLGTLALVVLLVAVAGYWFTGAPGQAGPIAAGPEPAGDASAAAASPHATNTEQIAAMVDKLAQRMKDNPQDAEGWAMLGRSYAVLGRNADAVPAYEKAVALRADDPVLLADYADALALRNERRLDGAPMKLIERALALDPKNLKALSLAGTAAFDRQDYAAAVRYWETIVQVAPPDSSYLPQVRASVDEARELGKLPPATAAAPAAPAAPAATAAATASVSGTVTLAPALAKKADPGDTVFVFARAAEGSRMPLAILKKQVKDLPIAFKLDDSMAMSPAARLSGAGRVVVGARVSKSGQATASPGDLSGLSAPVAVGSSGLTIEIADETRP